MILNVEIDKTDLVDLNEYADWYCSRADWKRESSVSPDAKVRIKSDSGAAGIFDLQSLTVKWDEPDRPETDVRSLMEDLGDWRGPEEDFDATIFVWGRLNEKTVLWAP